MFSFLLGDDLLGTFVCCVLLFLCKNVAFFLLVFLKKVIYYFDLRGPVLDNNAYRLIKLKMCLATCILGLEPADKSIAL